MEDVGELEFVARVHIWQGGLPMVDYQSMIAHEYIHLNVLTFVHSRRLDISVMYGI